MNVPDLQILVDPEDQYLLRHLGCFETLEEAKEIAEEEHARVGD